MNKIDIVKKIVMENKKVPLDKVGEAFMPTNIALCKYWGKRDVELNLPVTASLSIALPKKGTDTKIKLLDSEEDADIIYLNEKKVNKSHVFYKRISEFLNLFRVNNKSFHVDTVSNIPVAAGLASSASGFAALVGALNDLFDWRLTLDKQSVLARLGSGSAARSFWSGFVFLNKGIKSDGMDCFAESIECNWKELKIGLLMLDNSEKYISSRKAMNISVDTCPFYKVWPETVDSAIEKTFKAIESKDFTLLGETAEKNAMAMHSIMLSSYPAIDYSIDKTHLERKKVWELRKNGVEVYFTQDAGPNIKLLFLEKDFEKVKEAFPEMEEIDLFFSMN